ncbi:hypothetical protein QO259_05245 [Salinicola sp. JS01]|uniref:hypothetical protein n=1 Tax=Salinicola sp. JS01 TaxID=3050071 RepID=UPI00255BFEF2|nr:hypothetical protein [Salinicola sp. JS01]WIX34078.1 hypothetical protein QO259_05245 [Salinicola sp. JS01]
MNKEHYLTELEALQAMIAEERLAHQRTKRVLETRLSASNALLGEALDRQDTAEARLSALAAENRTLKRRLELEHTLEAIMPWATQRQQASSSSMPLFFC